MEKILTKDQFSGKLTDILDSLSLSRILNDKSGLYTTVSEINGDIIFTIYTSEGGYVWHRESPAAQITIKSLKTDNIVYKIIFEVSTFYIEDYPMTEFVYDKVIWNYTNSNLNINTSFYSIDNLQECLIEIEKQWKG